ncbi:MAG: hypothetical protein ABIJ12_08220 [bacterium]
MKSLFASLFVLLIIITSPLYNITAEEYIFVDLDGDGLDDNIKDRDFNGIPDFSVDVLPPVDDAESTGGSGIFASMPLAEVDASEITPKSKLFGRSKFSTRNLGSNRGGFSSSDGFGPDSGLSGSSFSGVCVGPQCH